jgi:hypothetical protein
MRLRPPSLPAIGLALAATGLVAACAAQPTAGPPAAAPAPPTATSAAAPTTAGATAPVVTSSAAEPGVESVSCGGVGPSGGDQVDLIADDSPAGRVGCTEAINVITDYYRDAPTMSEGTAHYLVVQGWACMADTGAYGSGSIGCSREGLTFHTEP